MQLGVNAWVWASPVNTEEFGKLAPKVKKMGFDLIEFGIESTSDLDYGTRRGHRQGQRARGQRLRRDGAGSRPHSFGRERFATTGSATSGTASRRRKTVGPRTSSGRSTARSAGPGSPRTRSGSGTPICWSTSSKKLSAYAGDHGVTLCVEPLNRFETSFMNLAQQAIEVVDRVGHPACGILLDTFHMNIEERSVGEAMRGGRREIEAPARLRERSRRARFGSRAVERGRATR